MWKIIKIFHWRYLLNTYLSCTSGYRECCFFVMVVKKQQQPTPCSISVSSLLRFRHFAAASLFLSRLTRRFSSSSGLSCKQNKDWAHTCFLFFLFFYNCLFPKFIEILCNTIQITCLYTSALYSIDIFKAAWIAIMLMLQN